MWHFLDIKDFDKECLSALLDTARDLKSHSPVAAQPHHPNTTAAT